MRLDCRKVNNSYKSSDGRARPPATPGRCSPRCYKRGVGRPYSKRAPTSLEDEDEDSPPEKKKHKPLKELIPPRAPRLGAVIIENAEDQPHDHQGPEENPDRHAR